MRRLVSAAVAPLLVLALAPAAWATFPGRNGALVVAVDRSDRYDRNETTIETVNARGRDFTEQSLCGDADFGPCEDRYGPYLPSPRYAPGGQRIAFGAVLRPQQLERPQWSGFGVIDAAGFDFHRGASVSSVAWSPRGDALLAEMYQGLWLMTPGGNHPRLLVPSAQAPDWSARGGLAYESKDDLWVRDRGGATRRLTRRGGAEPSWSPRGRSIAFERNGDIYVVKRSGKGLRRLTRLGGSHPVWAPDGSRIAFIRRRGLYTVGIHGRSLRELIPGHDPNPLYADENTVVDVDWQPLKG